MSIIAITCVDANWGIGYQGELLEHIPADMKFFRETTTGNYVIMGRKTWESLPRLHRPLKNRDNIIITSSFDLDLSLSFDRAVFTSLDQVVKFIKSDIPNRDIYIIGGASIYSQLLEYCDKAYITKVYKSHENVDSFFPNLDKMEDEWELTEESSLTEYKNFYYNFQTYERI